MVSFSSGLKCASRRFTAEYPALVLVLLVAANAQGQDAKGAPEAASRPTVVCLHNQLPWYGPPTEGQPFRLERELARQAVLIAARDELGLSTRDEALNEPFPKSDAAEIAELQLKVRVFVEGKMHLELQRSQPADASSEPWSFDAHFTNNARDAYISMLRVLDPLSRHELATGLRDLKLEGHKPADNSDNKPSADVEKLLGEMDLVSQFAAVRAAHMAIAHEGQSSEWLGVLVRGYANLAMLTEHHWCVQNEVFAARALLYAERMIHAAGNKNIVARAHRAYARAVVGMHGAALDELDEIAKLESAGQQADDLPDWLNFIGPYCRFDRVALEKLGNRKTLPNQLAARLSFEQYKFIDDERWLYESAGHALRACPMDYSIYGVLATQSYALVIARTGAYYGPGAMSETLAKRVVDLPGLPAAVRTDAAASEVTLLDKAGDPKLPKPFSIQPACLAQDLIECSQNPLDTDEPSWAVLGSMIAEEEFVQLANYLRVYTNAVERSQKDEADAFLSLVKGHQYAPYIESFTMDKYRDTKDLFDILNDWKFPEPRGNMAPAFNLAWNAQGKDDPKLQSGREASWRAYLDRNFTLPGLLEPLKNLDYRWWDQVDNATRQMFLDEIAAVSPHSPSVLRLKTKLAPKFTAESTAEWEKDAQDDPIVLQRLGYFYWRLGKYEDAVRCYQRSFDLSPSLGAVDGLAGSYWSDGKKEEWQPTLERMLKVEDLGLEHAAIHELIANHLISQGDVAAAEPHALEVANTWSAQGLQLASEVYEGLGKWDESEKWIKEDTKSYPSYAGYEWYFWCRRTGRGEVDKANGPAKSLIESNWKHVNFEHEMIAQIYYQLADEPQEALKYAKIMAGPDRQLEPYERVYSNLHVALIAHELKEKELEDTTLDEIRTVTKDNHDALEKGESGLTDVLTYICDLLGGQEIDEDRVAEMLKQVDSMSEISRRNYAYLAGRALELRSEGDQADKYYRLAIATAPFDKHCVTLAGYRLAFRHTTSRP